MIYTILYNINWILFFYREECLTHFTSNLKSCYTNICAYEIRFVLGAVRDERLNRMWNLKKVKFVRPSEEQGKENFFNIFVLHQVCHY